PLCAALADQNVARDDALAAVFLDPPTLAVRIATVPGGALSLLVCHDAFTFVSFNGAQPERIDVSRMGGSYSGCHICCKRRPATGDLAESFHRSIDLRLEHGNNRASGAFFLLGAVQGPCFIREGAGHAIFIRPGGNHHTHRCRGCVLVGHWAVSGNATVCGALWWRGLH